MAPHRDLTAAAVGLSSAQGATLTGACGVLDWVTLCQGRSPCVCRHCSVGCGRVTVGPPLFHSLLATDPQSQGSSQSVMSGLALSELHPDERRRAPTCTHWWRVGQAVMFTRMLHTASVCPQQTCKLCHEFSDASQRRAHVHSAPPPKSRLLQWILAQVGSAPNAHVMRSWQAWSWCLHRVSHMRLMCKNGMSCCMGATPSRGPCPW